MIRRPPRSTQSRSSAASDVYKRQAMNIGTFGETTALAILVGIFLATILLVVLLSMWGRGRRKAKESGVSQVANGATAVITAEPAAERDEGKEGGGSVKERVGEVVTEGRAYHTA